MQFVCWLSLAKPCTTIPITNSQVPNSWVLGPLGFGRVRLGVVCCLGRYGLLSIQNGRNYFKAAGDTWGYRSPDFWAGLWVP